jgi:RND family efflux transporter MFP subunit
MPARFATTSHHFLAMALVISMLASACGKKNPSASASGSPPVLVEVQQVKTGVLEDSSEFVGTLEAKQRVTLKPQIGGRIVQILVNQGDVVRRGTPMVQLRPEQNQASVNAAVAGVNAQQSTVANSQAAVKAAEAQVAHQISDIKRLEADLQNQEANLKLTQVNYQRAKILVTQGALAQQNLDNATQQINSAIAARDAAKQALEVGRKDLIAAQAQLKGAEATVDQNQSQLQRTRSELDVEVQSLDYNRVLAPIQGTVGDIPVRVGDYVNLGDSLTNIIQNDELDLRISVPTPRIPQLRRGLTVELLDAVTGKQLANGKMQFIAPQVNTGEQALLTKARFPNENGALRDGQFVRARVIWSQRPGILVPTVAVKPVGAQAFVFVAATKSQNGHSRQVAQQKPVKLGVTQGQNYQVISGINQADKLIVSGIQSLTDGAAIQPTASKTTAFVKSN